MPGAPNRPPEIADAPAAPAPAAAATPPPTLEPVRRVMRRLAPARVVLKLDLWKGQVPLDLFTPFDRAERAFEAADYPGADSQLDLLAVRLAEPRWPTIPGPFRSLRVTIKAPMPPNWDPENTLPPADRETRKTRLRAEGQLELATGSLAWARDHGVDVADLTASLEAARTALGDGAPGETFWTPLDALWVEVRARVPLPQPTASRRPAPVADAPADGA